MNKILLASALGLMSACTMSGWGGDETGNGKYAYASDDSSGRVLPGSAIGFINGSGDISSFTYGVKWNGRGQGAVQDAREKGLRGIWQTLNPGDHGGFDAGYNGYVGVSKAQKAPNGDNDADNYPNAIIGQSTTDTNRDGYLSGGFQCGISSVVYSTVDIPFASLAQDTTVCNSSVVQANGISTATTNSSGTGGHAFIHEDHRDFDNGIFESLPFDTRMQLLNSINSKSDVTSVRNKTNPGTLVSETFKLTLTSIRIGNATYTPNGVFVNVSNMKTATIDRNMPGAKLLAGWIANQAQKALNAGHKTLKGSVTVNGAVTLTSDQLPKNIIAKQLSQAWIDNLRSMATR